MKKSKKILKITGNVLLWLFVVFAAVMIVMAYAARKGGGVPTLGGKCFLAVESNSMVPTFKKGDMIIGRNISGTHEAQELENGTVITFWADLDGDGTYELNTHRIVDNTQVNVSGEKVYVTKGDNNASTDKPVLWYDVVAVYSGTRLAGLGTFINLLKSPVGFFLCIVLPLLLFFLYEVYRFIVMALSVKNSGKKLVSAADEELIRQKAIEEYLKQQAAEKAAESEDGPADAEKSAKETEGSSDPSGN